MIDAFLFIGLPYLSLAVCLFGCLWRWRFSRYTVSSLSSQFLEDRQLLWGSAPWHIGLSIILLGHLVAIVFPKIWASLLTIPGALMFVETVAIACSLLCVAGLSVLIVRRLTSARVQVVTTATDLVTTGLLLVQVVLGLLSAILYRFGATWSTGTITPYLWSLLTLHPDTSYVADFPTLFKLHLIGAWLLILLLPFSRLVHVLALPLGYLFRAPQLVLWNNPRHHEKALESVVRAESRREFLKGFAGLIVAGILLSLGAAGKMFNFFRGPVQDADAESALLGKKLRRLRQTAEERELELERRQKKQIFVAQYSELNETRGKYFIDYQMAPALAFKGTDGWPLLISAKCTHLGCTVGNEVDSQGRILCPCHVSYFSVQTGMPNPGAPAKAPLPHLTWALIDKNGTMITAGSADGKIVGQADPAAVIDCAVYVVKPVDTET